MAVALQVGVLVVVLELEYNFKLNESMQQYGLIYYLRCIPQPSVLELLTRTSLLVFRAWLTDSPRNDISIPQ